MSAKQLAEKVKQVGLDLSDQGLLGVMEHADFAKTLAALHTAGDESTLTDAAEALTAAVEVRKRFEL